MSIPDQRSGWASRLLLCFATAAAVSSMAYICAWYQYRGYDYFRFTQYHTIQIVRQLREDIQRHRETTGRLPARLEDLEVKDGGWVSLDDAGRVVDGWGRPFQYRVESDGYVLYSYGQDGQPGGGGLDAEVYGDEQGIRRELPTLWQFTTAPGTGGIQATCILAGMIAFPLCLLTGIWPPAGGMALVKVLAANTVTAAFCIVTAVVISVLHLPSGH